MESSLGLLEYLNEHFRPQWMFCGVNKYLDGFTMIRHENLTAEILAISSKLSMPELTAAYFRHSTRGRGHTTSHGLTIMEPLTDDQLQRIISFYLKDYQLFGYPIPRDTLGYFGP